MSLDAASRPQSSTVNFQGLSGTRYAFQAWPIGTSLTTSGGGVYVFTKRTFEDRTFTTKASHHVLGIGHTADFAAPLATEAERRAFRTQGANCICVCIVTDEARRLAIEKDLAAGHDRWGARLQYLFHPAVQGKAPGAAEGS
jgi:hypothetical protein